jgi:hypothetical protein
MMTYQHSSCNPFTNISITKITLLICSLLFISSNSYGKFYKCEDKDGNTVFSDTACSTSEREAVKEYIGPSDETLKKRSLDSCISYWKDKKPYLSGSNARIEGYAINLVGVKDIGLRKMVHMTISYNTDNESSKDVRTSTRLSCLMLGDGVTVNTRHYELE